MAMLVDRRDVVKALSLIALPAFAQDALYPDRALKLIVLNAPGSSVDTIGRRLGASLAGALGQSVSIDNKAGAAGAMGVDAGRISAPDGYTLIVASRAVRSPLRRCCKKPSATTR